MVLYRPMYIVIHHSVTPLGSGSSLARQRHYHKIIDFINDKSVVYQGCPDDRKSSYATGGANSFCHAICVVGNYSKRLPNQQMLNALVQTVLKTMDILYLDDVERIIGHRDAGRQLAVQRYYTECPGDALYSWLPTLRQEVLKRL